jgi:hypothetical protein
MFFGLYNPNTYITHSIGCPAVPFPPFPPIPIPSLSASIAAADQPFVPSSSSSLSLALHYNIFSSQVAAAPLFPLHTTTTALPCPPDPTTDPTNHNILLPSFLITALLSSLHNNNLHPPLRATFSAVLFSCSDGPISASLCALYSPHCLFAHIGRPTHKEQKRCKNMPFFPFIPFYAIFVCPAFHRPPITIFISPMIYISLLHIFIVDNSK